MARRIYFTLTLLFLFPTLAAFGHGPDSPPLSFHPSPPQADSAPVTAPASILPLEVRFTNRLLSVQADHVPLKDVIAAVAQQTGLTITLSPLFESIPVAVRLSQVEVEVAVQEILRRAGITNWAWTYRKKSHPAAPAEEWEPTRLVIVAEGHGATPPLPADASPGQSQPRQAQTRKRPLAREQYQDPHTNQLIPVAAREVLVRFDPKMSQDEIAQTVARLNAEIIAQVGPVGLCHLLIPETQTVAGFIRKHQRNPNFYVLEPNPIVAVEPVDTPPNDPLYRAQWALEQIGVPRAWTTLPHHGGGTVAVLDSGIDRTHPDLQGKVLRGWNTIAQNTDTSDDHGHGTAIGGIIAATTNNEVGMSGICPTCKLLPVKVLDESGEGTYADIIGGIAWAVEHQAAIINLSLGGYGYSRLLEDAVNQAHTSGAVIVAAAGNEATDAPLYPAALPDVISVAATDKADRPWAGSNYGPLIDVAAPGVGILSLAVGDQYLLATGSSFSAAQVAGVAGLVRTKWPALRTTNLAQLLFETAEDLGGKGKDTTYGFGRVNAARALHAKPRLF